MRELRRKTRVVSLFLIFLLLILAGYCTYTIKVYGTRWFANGRNIRVTRNTENIIAGNVYDNNGILLAYTDSNGKRKYQSNVKKRSSIVHVMGDSQNQVANGVERFQARYLYGFDASFSERVQSFIQKGKRFGDNVQLSLDSQLNTFIVDQFSSLPSLIGKNGGVVVMNYKTGEIISLVSLPVFDPQNIPQSAFRDSKKPFWNRATQSKLPPGSTFKIITLASALKTDINNNQKQFNCTGGLDLGKSIIRDFGNASHGDLNIHKAFEVSCNNVFASLALSISDVKLRETAESFGFNDNYLFRDIVVENSIYPKKNRSEFEIALTGIGQSKLLATPMHMCMIAASIANSGNMMEPMLINKVISHTGIIRYVGEPVLYRSVLDGETAEIIKNDMLNVVAKGTGTRAAVSGMAIAGKTGSAEAYIEGKPVTHAWFVGFSNKEKSPYAVCVMVESGGAGGSVAAPLAAKIFSYLNKHR